MAALQFARVFGPRILSFVGATPATPATPRTGLVSPLAGRYRRRWIRLRNTARNARIAVSDSLLTFWWVTALAFWLAVVFAVGISALAASTL